MLLNWFKKILSIIILVLSQKKKLNKIMIFQENLVGSIIGSIIGSIGDAVLGWFIIEFFKNI